MGKRISHSNECAKFWAAFWISWPCVCVFFWSLCLRATDTHDTPAFKRLCSTAAPRAHSHIKSVVFVCACFLLWEHRRIMYTVAEKRRRFPGPSAESRSLCLGIIIFNIIFMHHSRYCNIREMLTKGGVRKGHHSKTMHITFVFCFHTQLTKKIAAEL